MFSFCYFAASFWRRAEAGMPYVLSQHLG